MIQFPIIRKIAGGMTILGCCSLVAAMSSCSDYSDYNESPLDYSQAGNKTLWENISGNSQLSDFAALIREAGYDSDLSAPRSFTVWAPANGTFSPADYQGLTKEQILAQLVKGHVAEYNHVASGNVDERIHMLNEKSFAFEGNGTYTFGDIAITTPNLPASNGILHILNGAVPYRPNLYEYIKTAEGIDSLRNQIMNYEQTYLDTEASVLGPMVDGVQTYIDSVLVTYNTLTNQLNARLTNEDSSYTFIMPTDKAFLEMYNRVKPYYNFISTTKVHDVQSYTKASDNKTKTVTVNAPYMADSLTRRVIYRNLIYSNNDAYNQWVTGQGMYTDTLRSTTRSKFSNPRAILEDSRIGDPVALSNGYANIVDSLAFLPWEAYCPEININPRGYLANLFPNTASANRNVTIPDTLLERVFGPESEIGNNFRYMFITPGGDRAKADLSILLPDVMSTTYNFYVVFLPTALLVNEERPNWLNFQLNYCDAKGATQTYNFSKAYADSLRTGGPLPKVPTAVSTTTAFTNDPQKTDTVFIGQFKFPVAYKSLGDYYPSLHITSPISVYKSTDLASYSRDLRIAAIIMRPVELDEYEATKK